MTAARGEGGERGERGHLGEAPPTRTGRRPGKPDTKRMILDAARASFAEHGFAGASVRRIAAAAGVDPALVHHYFGTKERLFLATVDVPVDLPMIIGRIAAGGVDGFGLRMIGTLLSVWDSPAGSGLAVALRTALADPVRTRMLREFVGTQLIGALLRPLQLPAAEADLRAGLVMSQVAGLITGRYLLAVEPLASLPPAQLAQTIGATVQRYLSGPLVPSRPPHA